MRHVPRKHRVDLDWLFERLKEDPGIYIKFVGTKEQIADLMTKGAFTEDQWMKLCNLAQIRPPPHKLRRETSGGLTTDKPKKQ